MDILDIPKERRIEIDNILKKTEEDIKQNKTKSIPIEEFIKKRNIESLISAIKQNDIEAVRFLLENGADANSYRIERETLYRKKKGNPESDSEKLEKINYYTKYPVLTEAFGNNCKTHADPEIIKLLLEHGADPNATLCYGETDDNGEVKVEYPGIAALACAARQNVNKEIIELLLQYGADANAEEDFDNV